MANICLAKVASKIVQLYNPRLIIRNRTFFIPFLSTMTPMHTKILINHSSHQLMHTNVMYERPVCVSSFSFSIERIVEGEKKKKRRISIVFLSLFLSPFSRPGLISQRNWNSNEGDRVYTEFPQDSLHHRLFTGRYNHRGHRSGFMARAFPGFEVLYQLLISVFTSSKVNSDRINGFLG